ncbi:sodium channel protein Nach-like [Pectinophora gossypiella]|uniref:sodium channel protein Nach-like n=1 Tax=Pectinophora gossypiella TaxID=13191 RepID=UPI00214F0030|nr:sodium channel protein Nach-like [Pectinophora gossypiella]
MLYLRFEAMPTRITIENQFEPVAQLPYPAITLCSPNQMTISAMEHFNDTLVNGNRSVDIQYILPQLLGFYQLMTVDVDSLAQLQSLIEANRYSVPDVMVMLAQNCDDFLRVCIFKQRLYPHCRGLFRPILTKHGLCCIFNSMYHYKKNRRNEHDREFKPLLIGTTGFNDGLVVITDFNPANALDYTIPGAGATRVMYTDWTEFPADDESMLIPPNTESLHLLFVTATYCSNDVRELPPFSRKCMFEGERQLPFFWRYRNSDCDLLCLVRAVEERCHCLMLYLPHLRLQQVCAVADIQCIMEAKLNLNEWLEKDRCECLRDCDSRRYRADISVGNLNAAPYQYKALLMSKGYNKSSSVLLFYFPTPVYELLKQETVMSYTTLASNLGGVFGLCMGCSVISVMEICFYKYTAIRNCIQRRLHQRQRHRRSMPHYYD